MTPKPTNRIEELERELAELRERWERAANAYLIEQGRTESLERELARAKLALEDVLAIHADQPTHYAVQVRATASAALAGQTVEFCNGENPELTALYDLEADTVQPQQTNEQTATP